MKNHPYLKLFHSGFLLGFAGISVAIGSVHAADIGMAVLKDTQVQTHAKLATVIWRKNATLAKGAEGPIRTDTFSDQKPKVDSEMVRRDLELQRYPMANNVGIP